MHPTCWEHIFFGDQTLSSDPSMQHSPREISHFESTSEKTPQTFFCPHGKGQTQNRFNGNGSQLYFWSRCMFQSGFSTRSQKVGSFFWSFLWLVLVASWRHKDSRHVQTWVNTNLPKPLIAAMVVFTLLNTLLNFYIYFHILYSEGFLRNKKIQVL